MRVLVTGAAGFIGFHLSLALLESGDSVIGVDNLNDYYDVSLKEARLALLQDRAGFTFERASLEDAPGIDELFQRETPEVVVNLAAQAGVRYSLEYPRAYIDNNIVGFFNILESCRHHRVKHLIYASSSSVYGANTSMPFSVSDNVDHPLSLYGASKKANELMAHSYSHLYGIPSTGLRFFTVYGPWGRPDMAIFRFTRAMLAGECIDVYNQGDMKRDFTYIDDIVEGIVRVIDHVPTLNTEWNGAQPDPAASSAPYRIYNIGNNRPVRLLHLIEVLEEALGVEARKRMLPMQPGDVPVTYADITSLEREVGFRPSTPIETGVARFVAWYRQFYGLERNESTQDRGPIL